jgi:hypothetical protein
VGNLTEGEFIGIIIGGAAALVIASVLVTYTVMKRRHRYQTVE